jgi:hypothetical protein
MSKVYFPMPHSGQVTVMSSPARHKWIAAGRRWRKTTMYAMMATNAALKGETILWGAPTYDQVRIGWKECNRASHEVAAFKQARMTAEFPTGGEIIFRSLDDPNNARGHTANGVIVDEGAFIKADAWYDVLRPMISDNDGWSVIGGTPNGRNWFYRELKNAEIDPDSASYHAPTLGVRIENNILVRAPHPLENPTFKFSEAEKLFKAQPESTFRQEFMAEFITRAGLVYSLDWSVHVLARPEAEMQHWFMCADEGYTNPAVVLLVGVDGDGRLHIANELYKRGMLQSNVVAQAIEWGHRYNTNIIIVDRSAAGLIADLRDAGLDATPHQGRVLDGITLVQELMKVQDDGKPRVTVDPECINTIEEFESYVWKNERDEPVKADDHAMDAFRYGCEWLYGNDEEVIGRQIIYDPVNLGDW